MRKLYIILSAMAVVFTMTAQTITVKDADGAIKQINASDAGIMTYSSDNGTLTIGGQPYKVSNIDVDTENANISTSSIAGTTDAAKRLYRYFRNNYGKKVISSVMADVNWNNTCANNIKKNITGKWSAMNCYDFIHIQVPDGNGWIDYSNITPVTEWVNAGGIVQLMWHFNVPKSESTTVGKDGSGVTCTPSETTFKASNALKEGTWENKYFYAQMDRVIAVILKLQEAGIAATWRPFHEAAGNSTAKQQADWTKAWFWWGYDGAATFKKLWIAMFDYFKQKGVNNLIWIWTTQNYNGNSTNYNQDTDWYPGDAYCDMVARDLYGYNAAQNAQEFKEIQATYPQKMIVLGECGWDGSDKTGKPQGDIVECWNAGAKWGHFMVWYDGNAGNKSNTMVSDDWWKSAMKKDNSDIVITRGQVKY
ncbi:MAG: hypothetical protein IJQ04_07320 [Prevotella sp.]|nr:hypothetical protein [Prevotella sp.]